jgi:hypothetical protein
MESDALLQASADRSDRALDEMYEKGVAILGALGASRETLKVGRPILSGKRPAILSSPHLQQSSLIATACTEVID